MASSASKTRSSSAKQKRDTLEDSDDDSSPPPKKPAPSTTDSKQVEDSSDATKPPTLPPKSPTPKPRQLKQTTLPMRKKTVTTPKVRSFNSSPRRVKPPDNAHTRALTVTQTLDGTLIADIQTVDGKLCFFKPFSDYLTDDLDRAKKEHSVHAVMVARDPSSSTEVLKEESTTKGGKLLTKLKPLIVNLNDGNQTCPEYAAKWGEHLVKLHNSPKFQKPLFGNRNLAFFAGDLTPRKSDKPYLSDFFTIRHTLNLIKMSYAGQDLTEMLQNNDLIYFYFPEEMWTDVQEYHSNVYKFIDKKPQLPDGSDEDEIPHFKP